ncbi:hypothetical protein ACYOEI_26810 [Singulisphaera rosea]
MNRISRRSGAIVRSLFIALAIFGIELDVISNPFEPEFAFSQIFNVLDLSDPGADIGLDDDSDGDGLDEGSAWPVMILADASANELQVDETIALRPHLARFKPSLLIADERSNPLEPDRAGPGRSLTPPIASRRSVLPQLCRLVC